MIYDKLLKDISNQRFGKLVALKFIGSNKYKQAQWLCVCDCGNYTEVSGFLLRSGNVQSCGCLKSHGEGKIKQLLQLNNIDFITQYRFQDCVFPDTNALARFDFYINHYYVVEFDGEQHFNCRTIDSGWNTHESFIRTRQRDMYKDSYCFVNNIPIIRIPYTHLSHLCIEDLLLETSNFILTENNEKLYFMDSERVSGGDFIIWENVQILSA